eukprot:g3482.t1
MRLVFTVLDWDRFSSDDFLGQVSVPVPRLDDLSTFASSPTDLDHAGASATKIAHERRGRIAKASYELALGSLDGELKPEGFKISDERAPGQGSIRVELEWFGGAAHSMCGELKVGEASRAPVLQPAWVVLAGTRLWTYDSYGDVKATRDIEMKGDVVAVKLDADAGTVKLSFQSQVPDLTMAGEQIAKWAQQLRATLESAGAVED